MFEFKYFAKIAAYEEAEKAATDPQPLPPFNIEALGTDGILPRAVRRFTRWFYMFAFAVLRTVWPVARIGRLVVVTRHADVVRVLNDSEHFPVPFGPEMRAITDGEPFALGLDGNEHKMQRDIVDALLKRDDAYYLLDRTRYVTEALIKGSGGRIDVMRDLLGRVFTETCSDYFGLDIDEPNAFLDRSMAISALLFADPLGKESTRRLTLNGAVRVRYLIDRAIARARSPNQPPRPIIPLVDRLVAHRLPCGGRLTNQLIRSIVIGVMTGMVPTNTLAAGKMIEELQRRGLLQSAIGAAVAAEKKHKEMIEELALQGLATDPKAVAAARRSNPYRQALWGILFEAARLNPALLPGQFRHAPKATSIAGTPVPAGSVLMVATMSALRDGRAFSEPSNFDSERKISPPLMFGDGSHHCPGTYLALEQATEICQILFAQPGIRFSRHPAGWLSYIGPFPRRLDLEFDATTAPSTQNLITIGAQVAPRHFEDVKAMIEDLGNPAEPGSEIRTALDKTGVVHFASLSAFNAADPDDPKAKPNYRLVLELNVDGDQSVALDSIAREAGPALGKIFELIEGGGKKTLRERLQDHKITLHSLPWGPIGLNFNGTPDCPVGDIERQDEVATFARDAIEHYLHFRNGVNRRAMDALAYVRSLTHPYVELHPDESSLFSRGQRLREFLIRPTRRRLALSEFTGYDAKLGWQGAQPALQSNAAIFLGLLIGSTFLLQGGAIHFAIRTTSWIAFSLALLGVVGGAILIGSLFFKSGFERLARSATVLMDGVVQVLTVLAFGLSAALLLAFLLWRWIALPAALVAATAASVWAVRRWLPDLSPTVEILLVASGVVCVAVAAVVVVAVIKRYWKTVLALLAGGAAAFWVLQRWLPEMSLDAQIVCAALAAVITAGLVANHRRVVGWLLVAAAMAAVVIAGWLAYTHWEAVGEAVTVVIAKLGALAVALAVGVGATFLIWLVPAIIFLGVLYWYEKHDAIDERTAPLDHIEAIAKKENAPGYAQNHITAVTLMKPGGFRKLTLALTLWVIGKEIQYWFRPGFVLNMGTIHYAKWFRLPGTEMMLFLANYDGSWQSYLEDFVTKAHEGQSAVWSHGKGFPKTRLLVFGGAADGDRFKRWVRRQQIVTQFWYSRFPHLTTDQVRNNALIHDGLMRAQTDTAARAWLDCFGTMPRPDNSIQGEEVQSLVFRGLPTHPYMVCAAITFGDAQARRAWLRDLAHLDLITYGEQPDVEGRTVTFVAFSAQGIAKCLDGDDRSMTSATMATFPPAFRLGMGSRGRVLGDSGPSELKEWRWADVDRAGGQDGLDENDKAVDALLLVYGSSVDECRAVVDEHARTLKPEKLRMVITQPTAKTAAAGTYRARGSGQESPMYEHFGFRDGISQPVIRGSQREAASTNAADVVEAGELILGYVNSGGYRAPAITLPAERDGDDFLETDSPDFPARFPRFAESQDSDRRDFGRNGTFLAVRQLAQDVDGFNQHLEDQRKELLKHYDQLSKTIGGPITTEWIAAKMMGRWRSGVSVIRWPHAMGDRPPPGAPDNDFSFGAEDPQGLRCPFGAHIRRANPRGSLAPDDPAQANIEKRHRLLRRGRAYVEPADGKTEADGETEKGLLFIGVCADLERQFEFLQQTWIGSPFFHGLTNEPDPFSPATSAPSQQDRVFTIPTPSGPVTMKGLKSFVTVKGGGYFFMPSRSAMRFLGQLAAKPALAIPAATTGQAPNPVADDPKREREDA
jgi:Dyp-type peroxidase family